MALLVKEQKALLQLEQAYKKYWSILLGEELHIDDNKTVEERLIFLATQLSCSL
jgi:hypothetical protein